jgi:trans-2,3-dihydro-3-hydroxyanthranilate isomerase
LSLEFKIGVANPRIVGDRKYRTRIFENGHELPFGGMPTLGTAWVLGPGSWSQESPGAVVEVQATPTSASVEMPDPIIEQLDLSGEAADALGLPSVIETFRSTCGGNTHLLAPTEVDVAEATPDFQAIRELSRRAGTNTVATFSLAAENLRLRVFAPALGMDESPAVGTAAAPAALWSRQRWGLGPDLDVVQGEFIARKSLMRLHASWGAVRLGGDVKPFAEGVCQVP